eukprot:c25257_g1_i1 orf=110-1408(+)
MIYLMKMAAMAMAALTQIPPSLSLSPLPRVFSPLGNPPDSLATRTSRIPPSCALQAGHDHLVDAVKAVGRTLWGRGLPPEFLVGAVRTAWTGAWMVMMKQLAPSDQQGDFQRPASKFCNRPPRPVSPAEKGRYHLYVSLSCPWAHRTAIVHSLKGLDEAVPVSVAVPGSSGLWEFRPQPDSHDERQGMLHATVDMANGCKRLKDVYSLRKGGYDGRATVPMLWDSVQKEVVNNESADIIEVLNSDFNELAHNPKLDLAPHSLSKQIAKWNSIIYPSINNGVYRCGFAQSQGAYDSAVENIFSTLEMLEKHLSSSRYLCGDHFTLADVRLFTTLFRFDPVYNILFKCSKCKLSEYPNLYGYMQDIYQMPGVASTCDLEAIMAGYYQILFPLNPGGILPIMPVGSNRQSLLLAHNRECISATEKRMDTTCYSSL